MKPQDHGPFMSRAIEVAQISNCIRRSVGAVLVREEHIIVEGWNGVLEGHKDCREAGCSRCINGGITGSGYESCLCIHAEQRAIAEAAKGGVSTDNSVLYVSLRPCLQCLAIAKACGVGAIFYCGDDWNYSEELEKIYNRLSGQFKSFSRTALA